MYDCRWLWLFLAIFIPFHSGIAEVRGFEQLERSDVLGGRSLGPAGPYERIVARAYFAVDPKAPANQRICDIELAPRNEEGLVEFSADLYVLKPRDPRKGNGVVLFEVVNRGRQLMLRYFNLATGGYDPRSEADFGDFFLMKQGYTLVWLGWQFDVPMREKLLRLYAPIARGPSGPVFGLVRSEFIPDRVTKRMPLADRDHIPYPIADPQSPENVLYVRDRVEESRKLIPRQRWRFVKEDNSAGYTHVEYSHGFEPGRIYELVYRSRDPVVIGLGMAAIRDYVSFLRYRPARRWLLLADHHRYIRHAIAFGASQSGRFLRTFLYEGFNADEQGRQVFDGMLIHVAGAGRGSFNLRFGQASRDGHPFYNVLYPTDLFPFTDLPQQDPDTGLTEGLLDRARKAGVVPKIFYVNSSYEYWGRVASLTHTSVDGKKDWPLPDTTRIYMVAGTQHAPGRLPPGSSEHYRYLANPHDFRPLMRALLVALTNWVVHGVEPPASRYPQIRKATLVPVDKLAFPRIPGVELPVRPRRAFRLDWGSEFRRRGIMSIEPPRLGRPFPVLVPQVDPETGNEVAGVKLPFVAVPLGTFTGWNLRTPKIGAPQEIYSMVGSFFPFPRTRQEAKAKGDPRPAIVELYENQRDYLDKVRQAAKKLVGERLLLEQDIQRILDDASKLWDLVVGP